MKNRFAKKLLSILLCMALMLTYLPLTTYAATTTGDYYSRVVDANTMDLWKDYFPLETIEDNPLTAENEYKPLTTANAGGVWTDKSVFTNADAFDGKVSMLDDTKNFLTSLSAIAANKEVVGYSTVPTDTVLVLDLSRSISDQNAEDALIAAANNAIASLLEINENNRVGVVLYSGESATSSSYENAVTRILEIDHYTTTTGTYLDISRNNNVTVNSGVSGKNTSGFNKSKSFTGYTYMQAGLWEAWKMFEAVPDITVGDNNWQSGDYRMPIVVLMTDGEPSQATTYYNDVENSQYTSGRNTYMRSNVGNGYGNIPAGQGFLVQLTASYIKSRIENKYQVKSEDGAGRSLFYTLGFEVDDMNVAQAILDPANSTATDNYWSAYSTLTGNNTVSVQVRGRSGSAYNTTTVNIAKDSYVRDKYYVDEYFSAESGQLENAFKSIVDEIILQSRYYPTHLEGGSPDFSGYVEFTDTLGEYMEVKHINGILLGDTLFDGHMMASKLSSNSADGLGTVENPTALGDEFIKAVKTRLGIADTADAQALVAKAFADGQLGYTDADNWSNYIMWYAKADGTYAGFCDKDGTETVPEDAVYKIKSYGFLGETTGSIKNSDMMYMSVQVKTDIVTGVETVSWKIPASLVPMITYLVELDGTSVDYATNVRISVEDKTVEPIRLIFESGLRSDLNEFNITRITEQEHLAADGHTRVFWNNYFANLDADSHDQHITAMSEFTPNKENERFYYTFNSAVHKKVGENQYALVTEAEGIDPENNSYYHRRYIFSDDSAVPVFFYEEMSKESAKAAFNNGFKTTFESLEHNTVGAWVVPEGTPARELDMYDKPKDANPTDSARMVFHPYMSAQNNLVYVDMNLGNNGRLSVTPATGIKISKTIDIFETGTSDSFKFRITANTSGAFNSWITNLDATPEGEATTATFTNGVYEFELKKDQTFWLTGIDAGTVYTVEEISDNTDYKIKSVHVNGVSTGKAATGTVTQYLIDDVDFVNTAVGEGDLVITKQVVDANGNTVDVSDDIEFTINVALTNASGAAVSGAFEATGGTLNVAENGKFTIKLSDGESFVVRGIPEETRYTVTEENASGFTLNTEDSILSGVVDSSANDHALVVNTYTPTGTNGNGANVEVTKTISGNRTTWRDGESYTFNLERLNVSRGTGTVIATDTISYNDTEKKISFSLANETYATAGTYYYKITEAVGTQGGITYDTAERRFSVVVADSDMDGDLEITAVTNIANTTVSGNWTVSASFNNVYAPTGSDSITINIQKAINDNQSLSGYRFALYDADPRNSSEYTELLRSPLTNAAGETQFNLVFPASMAGETYTYYLAEVPGANPNITYTDKVYEVKVTVTDNGDGTVSANLKVLDGASEITSPEIPFTNIYTPSSSDYVVFSGEKEISTNNRVINANEFTFNIAADATTPNAPLPAILTAKNSANGSFQFAPIEFTAAGEYKYVITEDDTHKIGGFKYDDARYEITVTVTDSNAALTANITRLVKVKGSNTIPVTDIVFENEYLATPATVELSGAKHLVGKTMEDGEFNFVINAVTSGAPMPTNSVVSNDKYGVFDFGTITFNTAGTYVYTVTEQNGGDARFDYDESAYTVTVVVTDNAEGKLSAAVSMLKNGIESNEIVFVNSFTPTPYIYDIDDAAVNFTLGKELSGRPLEEGEFEFVLINAISGQQIGEAVANDLSGKIDFPALTLSEAGTYHYKIMEVISDEKGVTYDTTVYHVVVGIAQEDDGDLVVVRNELHKATVVIDDSTGIPVETTVYEDISAGKTAIFKNSYSPDPTAIVLSGMKHLTGRELKEGEFTFNLYFAKMENGEWVKAELVEQVKNDADGSFKFKDRVAETPATFIYFITEDATDPDVTITYDETEYMVVVTTTDNLDGTMSITYDYTVNGDNAEGISFTNTYTAPPTPPAPTPEPEIPKTGDSSNLWMWLAVMFVSGGGLISSLTLRRKKEETDK